MILALATIIAADATAQTSPELDIKAAYLYAFAKFIEWPKDVMSSTGSIKACVLGADEVADSLNGYRSARCAKTIHRQNRVDI